MDTANTVNAINATIGVNSAVLIELTKLQFFIMICIVAALVLAPIIMFSLLKTQRMKTSKLYSYIVDATNQLNTVYEFLSDFQIAKCSKRIPKSWNKKLDDVIVDLRKLIYRK